MLCVNSVRKGKNKQIAIVVYLSRVLSFAEVAHFHGQVSVSVYLIPFYQIKQNISAMFTNI